MDRDLQDLLIAWTGGDLEPERCAGLFARLEQDEAFAKAFADELWMLGKVKAVQTTEPRWLRLEDEIGWTAAERPDRLRAAITDGPRSRAWWCRAVPLAGAAAALLAVTVAWWALTPATVTPPVTPLVADQMAAAPLAEVVAAMQVVRADGGTPPAVGQQIIAGPLHLAAGRLSLVLHSGTQVDLEGPVDCTLTAVDRLVCRSGMVHVQVPTGMSGFTVETPRAAVVDLGTAFAVTVDPDGTSSVQVSEGHAEVILLDERREPQSSTVLGAGQAAVVDHRQGRIEVLAPSAQRFTRLNRIQVPDLVLDPGYASAVQADQPWAWWRFDPIEDGRIANAVPGGPALLATGPVAVAGPAGNRHLVLPPSETPRWLALAGTMPFDQQDDYAVELWLARETPTLAALVSICATSNRHDHVLMLEVGALGFRQMGDLTSCRLLHRWPPGREGGTSILAPSIHPNAWHHVVGQKRGGQLELYVDGKLVRRHAVAASGSLDAAQLIIGRMDDHPGADPHSARRPFVGRIDELALYRHALTPEHIADHARRGRTAASSP